MILQFIALASLLLLLRLPIEWPFCLASRTSSSTIVDPINELTSIWCFCSFRIRIEIKLKLNAGIQGLINLAKISVFLMRNKSKMYSIAACLQIVKVKVVHSMHQPDCKNDKFLSLFFSLSADF